MRQEGANETTHKVFVTLTGVALAAILWGALAQSTTLTQANRNLIVRLQITAPGDVGNDSMHLLERQLHRGAKPAGKTYHVLVAIYDEKTGQRSIVIEAVTAKVVDSHGIAPATRLEPMSADGEVGYGNYLDFGHDGPYGIMVSVQLGAEQQPIEVEFSLAHLPE